VLADLRGRIDLIVDGGPAPVGVESTIVACLEAPALLRPGGLPRAAIEQALGEPLADPPAYITSDDARLAPGMLASHYAPKAKLRLDVTEPRPGEALLAFGARRPAGGRPMLNLSETGDLVEAAANLFSHLRALDAAGASTIAVMPVPRTGLGEAINDRLQRAAGPRAET
jgi:L-threonylcarbamoyladenylate synthase